MKKRKKSKVDNYSRFCDTPGLARDTHTDYRDQYDRDYARVLHSPSFRRLQNKTQLFPGQESDFFRSRLTHSLEVAQIARSIAYKLKKENPGLDVEPRVCEIAGLVHDIGHPPFGHNGERALDACMRHYGGFEGNAQTFRILTRLERKELPPKGEFFSDQGEDYRVGLNLTARVLASTLKYDHKIEMVRNADAALEKGYYDSEFCIVEEIKRCLGWNKYLEQNSSGSFKTIECAIMDLADDIAYSTYDMEDAFKAGFLTPFDMLAAGDNIYDAIAEKLKLSGIGVTKKEYRDALLNAFNNIWDPFIERQKSIPREVNETIKNHKDKTKREKKNIYKEEYKNKTIDNFLEAYNKSKEIASDGYKRTELTSAIVNSFINGVRVKVNNKDTKFSKVYFEKETELQVNILKHFSYVALINSPRLKVSESRGEEIISKMFYKLSEKGGEVLLPESTRKTYYWYDTERWHKRVICDFIAGMTDRYALEFYGRLFSENPQTIFKPLD